MIDDKTEAESEAKAVSRKELMLKWLKLLKLVEERFTKAVEQEENGEPKAQTEKAIGTYIKTLQAFAKEMKEFEANGEIGQSAAGEVAQDLWALSLSRSDRAAIASILKELGLSAHKVPGTSVGRPSEAVGGGKPGEQASKREEIQEGRAAQRELSFDEPRDEGEDGPGTLEAH